MKGACSVTLVAVKGSSVNVLQWGIKKVPAGTLIVAHIGLYLGIKVAKLLQSSVTQFQVLSSHLFCVNSCSVVVHPALLVESGLMPGDVLLGEWSDLGSNVFSGGACLSVGDVVFVGHVGS